MVSNKIVLSIALSFFLLSLLAQNVHAIGITPSRVTFNFKPNMEGSDQFCVLNTAKTQLNVELYISGALAQYMDISAKEVHFAEGEYIRCFVYYYKLPETLEPGLHDTRIGALEAAPPETTEGTTISTRAGVEMQFWVEVPYPGKYLKLLVGIPDTNNVNTRIPVELSVKSLGTEITRFNGSVDIFDYSGNKLVTLKSSTETIGSQSTRSVMLEWAGTTTPGVYRAIGHVTYESGTANATKEFRIGDKVVKISRITAKNIRQGTIGKIEIELQSFWTETITGISTEVIVKDSNGALVKTITLDPVEVPGWQSKTIAAYFDTKGVPPGKYHLDVILRFGDKTSQDTAVVDVISNLIIYAIIILVTVAVVAAVVWLVKKGKIRLGK